LAPDETLRLPDLRLPSRLKDSGHLISPGT
jgi:hypothetical protein